MTSLCPFLIIKWTTISDLNTIVHVESRIRSWRVRKTSATPASPVRVAMRICSTYLSFGTANCALNQYKSVKKISRADLEFGGSFDGLFECVGHVDAVSMYSLDAGRSCRRHDDHGRHVKAAKALDRHDLDVESNKESWAMAVALLLTYHSSWDVDGTSSDTVRYSRYLGPGCRRQPDLSQP